MKNFRTLLVLCFYVAACSPQSVVDDDMRRFEAGPLPADFSGSWQRNYARDEHINKAVGEAYDQLARRTDPALRGTSAARVLSSRDTTTIVALARLAELITRPDVLTIMQDEYEIRVDRKDDFSLLCAFFDGETKATQSAFGTEICGWDGEQLVSHLSLPGGLQITHRFAMSPDRQQLRVTTTVVSDEARVPLTIRRYYTKFDRPAPRFNCIETLSMKRVCSTGELGL